MIFLPEEELGELAERIRTRVEAIEIAAYVRPPAAYITSRTQQRVRGTPGAMRHRPLFEPDEMYPHYRLLFEKFDRIFGRENVHLWKFDTASFPGGCVVRDFCSRLSIDLSEDRIVRVNESISREVMGLLYTYRVFGRRLGSVNMDGPQNKRLVEALKDVGGSKVRLSPRLVRRILETNRPDIEWMQARLGESLEEDLGDDRPGDIGDDSDLIRIEPELAAKLRGMLGEAAPAGVNGRTPEEVAELVHALYLRASRTTRPGSFGRGQHARNRRHQAQLTSSRHSPS
jgi:hypothetical protein